jgi:hypothetical protein
LKLSFNGGYSSSKKCKRGGAYGGVWRSLLLPGVWSQAVGFVLVHFAGFCRRENVFTFNLLYKAFYRF